MPPTSQPTVLVILDGFGHSQEKKYNAIDQAAMPHFKKWLKEYPHTIIQAAGTAVGLPKGFIGNSEVGHLTIGAGRIITQDLVRINNALQDGSFYTIPTLVDNFTTLAQTGNNLHLMGLLSDGGVHSHQDHLYALLKIAKSYNIENVFVHAFLDGRDVSPQSAARYLEDLETVMHNVGCGALGSITGRYYAMDRDNNWQRTQQCYDSLTQQQTPSFTTWQEALDYYYTQDITDEFIPPTQLMPASIVHNHDGILFFNFRSDRARQLTQAFIDPQFNHFETKKYNLAFFITMTEYDHKKYPTDVLFGHIEVPNTLKEILQANSTSMFSIAETEKYAHVTYFFNGMNEEKLPLETRVLIPSLPRKNYIECPEMSAEEITNAVIDSLKTNPKDFYLINYANADMVGHSGDFAATVKACEFLDVQLKRLYDQVIATMNGTLIITADHGNAEDMFDEKTKQPRTAHTINPVYFLVMNKELKNKDIKLDLNQLSDIAPFILKNIGLAVPPEMK